jgi:O-antigen biosynthesis protein
VPYQYLSFIVPVHNRLDLTQATVAGLGRSLPEGLDYEVIVVDDGSTDGTREWLRGLKPPFRAVLNDRNLGYAAANNRGAATASGEVLALLNNDLVLRPGWLEPMLEALELLRGRAGLVGNVQRDARTGAVDHAGIVINHKGKPEHLRKSPWRLRAANRFKRLLRVPAVTGACALVLNDVWRLLGGFDEGFRNGCEDVDLCLRAEASGYRNVVALRSVVGHHISASPGRKEHDEENTRRLVEKWRRTLVRLGIEDWCRHHFETYLPEPRDYPDPALARQLALHLLGLTPRPPAGAYPGMDAAIGIEIERWRAILGPSPAR